MKLVKVLEGLFVFCLLGVVGFVGSLLYLEPQSYSWLLPTITAILMMSAYMAICFLIGLFVGFSRVVINK